MSEFTPTWTNVKMTSAQIRKYIKDMKNAQQIAKQKLEKAKNSWELELEEIELDILEKKLDNL